MSQDCIKGAVRSREEHHNHQGDASQGVNVGLWGFGLPGMAQKNKPDGDLNSIRSQTDDLLKSLDSVDTTSNSSPRPSSTGSARYSSAVKPPPQKSSSSSVKTILIAAGSLAGIAIVIIGGLVAFEASKQATLSREAELARQQAIRDQAALAKERAALAKERAEREKAEREAKEREEIEQMASLRGQLKSKGWEEAGSSGLLYRWCNPGANKNNLGLECSDTTNSRYWFGLDFYCLSASCSGVIEGAFGDSQWNVQVTDSRGYISLKPNQRRTLIFSRADGGEGSTWPSRAAGYCNKRGYWREC